VRLSDAEVAVTAAEAGAAIVRAMFGTSLDRIEKAPMDFATAADIDAENAILEVLRTARPADAYQGEELGASGNDASDRTWLIDPLCGTLNYAAQTPLMAVNIAPPYPNGERFQAVRMLADPAFMTAFRPRVLSTTLALAWVAAGRRAAYVTDGHLRDSVRSSSGIALCQAAGCVVTGLRGEPLHTRTGGLIAAADEQTHAVLLEIIDWQFRT
jgi:myo-inositol-1(or 4)-monophosphatase